MGRSGSDNVDRARAARLVRIVCGGVALIAVLAGLSAHTFREALGLGPDAAFGVAGGLGLMGVLYGSVLFWWDRIELCR